MNYKDNFRKGFLDMLVLEILSRGDCYGYEISQVLKEASNNYISVLVSSLYPSLYRMEEKGMITSYRKRVGKKMERVYYHLEEKGYNELVEQKKVYKETINAIDCVLNYEKKEMIKSII